MQSVSLDPFRVLDCLGAFRLIYSHEHLQTYRYREYEHPYSNHLELDTQQSVHKTPNVSILSYIFVSIIFSFLKTLRPFYKAFYYGYSQTYTKLEIIVQYISLSIIHFVPLSTYVFGALFLPYLRINPRQQIPSFVSYWCIPLKDNFFSFIFY